MTKSKKNNAKQNTAATAPMSTLEWVIRVTLAIFAIAVLIIAFVPSRRKMQIEPVHPEMLPDTSPEPLLDFSNLSPAFSEVYHEHYAAIFEDDPHLDAVQEIENQIYVVAGFDHRNTPETQKQLRQFFARAIYGEFDEAKKAASNPNVDAPLYLSGIPYLIAKPNRKVVLSDIPLTHSAIAMAGRQGNADPRPPNEADLLISSGLMTSDASYLYVPLHLDVIASKASSTRVLKRELEALIVRLRSIAWNIRIETLNSGTACTNKYASIDKFTPPNPNTLYKAWLEDIKLIHDRLDPYLSKADTDSLKQQEALLLQRIEEQVDDITESLTTLTALSKDDAILLIDLIKKAQPGEVLQLEPPAAAGLSLRQIFAVYQIATQTGVVFVARGSYLPKAANHPKLRNMIWAMDHLEQIVRIDSHFVAQHKGDAKVTRELDTALAGLPPKTVSWMTSNREKYHVMESTNPNNCQLGLRPVGKDRLTRLNPK